MDRPIIFSGPMVKAILEGRKTQTRRVVKNQDELLSCRFDGQRFQRHVGYPIGHDIIPCPYGEPGDRLWVRETFCWKWDEVKSEFDGFLYSADGKHVVHVDGGTNRDGSERSPWMPSIHMPREASRITLEITNVRVERLQDITQRDCIKEGILRHEGVRDGVEREEFRDLWDKINGKKHPWSSNPWVWVIEFRRIDGR